MDHRSERDPTRLTTRRARSDVPRSPGGIPLGARRRTHSVAGAQRSLAVTLLAWLFLAPHTTTAQVTPSTGASVSLIVVKQPPAAPSTTGASLRLPTGETVRQVGPQVLDVTAPIPFAMTTGDVLGLTRRQCTRGDHPSRLFVRDSTGRLVIVPEAAAHSPVMLSATAERVVRYRVIAEPGQSPESPCLRYELFAVNGQLIADREDVLHLPRSGGDTSRR
jgi:hypothetical protein